MKTTIKAENGLKFDIKPLKPCRDALAYYESKTSSAEAWQDCHRGDWMLWAAHRLGVDDRTLTRAKALCANTVRHLMMDERSTSAIDAALRYADGDISRDELNRYAIYAADAFAAAAAAVADAAAAAYAAYAAYAAAADDVADYYAADAADAAAYVAADAAAAAANQLLTADICREVLTVLIMRIVNA